MSGLFEYLANTDDSHRVAGRKAVALARVRADKSFGRFIAAAVDMEDRDARLTLVAGDLEQLVKQACADCDYHAHENVLATIQEHLGYIVEARRPKMCPYHNEVTDISLASGEPQSGFAAMAQHAWGPKHCQGGEYEGGCNFKPEMTTQSYWDNKAQQAQERREERQRQMEMSQPQLETPELEREDTFDTEFNPPEDGTSAVGIGAEPAVADPMAMAASTRTAEALETVDVTKGGETPSPKMDKKKWTPENVSFLDAESEGSPHPTEHQDIAQPAQYKGDGRFGEDGRFDQTNAVLEKQDVDKRSNPTDGGGPSTSTFPKGNQAKPVTSATPGTDPMAIAQMVNQHTQGGMSLGQAVQTATQSMGLQPGEAYKALYQNNPNNPRQQQPVQQQQVAPGQAQQQLPPPQQQYAAVDPDKNPILDLLDEEEAQRAIASYKKSYSDPGGDEAYFDSGGRFADPYSQPTQYEHDDPHSPYYDPPCPNCGARQGAFEDGHCMACGYQENNVPGSGPGGPGVTPPAGPSGPMQVPGEFS